MNGNHKFFRSIFYESKFITIYNIKNLIKLYWIYTDFLIEIFWYWIFIIKFTHLSKLMSSGNILISKSNNIYNNIL